MYSREIQHPRLQLLVARSDSLLHFAPQDLTAVKICPSAVAIFENQDYLCGIGNQNRNYIG
jgi:hypothetical protein